MKQVVFMTPIRHLFDDLVGLLPCRRQRVFHMRALFLIIYLVDQLESVQLRQLFNQDFVRDSLDGPENLVEPKHSGRMNHPDDAGSPLSSDQLIAYSTAYS